VLEFVEGDTLAERIRHTASVASGARSSVASGFSRTSACAGGSGGSGRSSRLHRSSEKTTPRRNLRARTGMPTYRAHGGSHATVT
jgi:hypothetical protein